MAREMLERRWHIRIEFEAGKGLEIAGDGIGVAVDSKGREGGGQTLTTDLLVGPVRAPVRGDVAVLPGLPEGFDVDVGRPSRLENALKGIIGALTHADQGAENVKRQKLETLRLELAVHRPLPSSRPARAGSFARTNIMSALPAERQPHRRQRPRRSSETRRRAHPRGRPPTSDPPGSARKLLGLIGPWRLRRDLVRPRLDRPLKHAAHPAVGAGTIAPIAG